MRRSRLEDVLEVLREIRRLRTTAVPDATAEDLRREAVNIVATRELERRRFSNQYSAEKSIHDACGRRSMGEIGKFDEVVTRWLSGDFEQLKNMLAPDTPSEQVMVAAFLETPSTVVPDGTSRPEVMAPEEVPPTLEYPEGAVLRIQVNRYERDETARACCIEHYGPVCTICEFSFADVYGPLLSGFIHIHHLKPLATAGGSYSVDPILDLRPLCANCHAVVHRREPPYTIEEVKAMLSRKDEMGH
ncbi:HNH endonuclease [Nitrospira sp. T9]|uniref:HNH endonuclease n=1 Tax=unclassified Nitrospira TaxID=2652172 RepID=UPI003F9A04DF